MKILKSLKSLEKLIKFKKSKNKTIVLCHGVFDIIHAGHIKYFKEAKSQGDFIVASITADKYVNKGQGRPFFNQDLRAEVIESLKQIDVVYINHEPTAIKLIKAIKPDIYFKGPDYINNKKDKTGNIYKEINAIKESGGQIKYSNDITFSSSNLINNYFNNFNLEQKKFITNIKKKYSFDYIFDKVNSFKSLKVLLIGETIIDQYIYGDTLGKSGKEPHLVIKEDYRDDYLGGAAAIANHLATFCDKIQFISVLGQLKEYLRFINKLLKKNVCSNFIYKNNSPTILKTRFIDNISKNKILGVYKINDEYLNKKIENKLQKKIKKISKSSDIIIVSDYGHGFISDQTANIITSQKKLFTLNAQINASNYGYHSLKKYKKIDTLIINENELRHEMRDKKGKIEDISSLLVKSLKINILIVTRGNQGSFMVRNKKITYCPAFATKVVDKIGAGDTMLSIISLCIKKNLPEDLTLFLGSLAGGFSVENMANSKFLNKTNMLRQIEFLLK